MSSNNVIIKSILEWFSKIIANAEINAFWNISFGSRNVKFNACTMNIFDSKKSVEDFSSFWGNDGLFIKSTVYVPASVAPLNNTGNSTQFGRNIPITSPFLAPICLNPLLISPTILAESSKVKLWPVIPLT